MKSYAEFCEHYGYTQDEAAEDLYREYQINFRLFEDFKIAEKENEAWKKKIVG